MQKSWFQLFLQLPLSTSSPPRQLFELGRTHSLVVCLGDSEGHATRKKHRRTLHPAKDSSSTLKYKRYHFPKYGLGEQDYKNTSHLLMTKSRHFPSASSLCSTNSRKALFSLLLCPTGDVHSEYKIKNTNFCILGLCHRWIERRIRILHTRSYIHFLFVRLKHPVSGSTVPEFHRRGTSLSHTSK